MDWSDPHCLRKILAANMRRLRKAQGVSQEELAHRTDLQQSYLSEIEHAKRNVSVDNVQRIAMALKVTPAEIQTPE